MRSVNGIAATARILVVVESTVTFPNNRIEVAISVQIGKGGGAAIPNRNAIEGVGGSCLRSVKAGSGGEVVVGDLGDYTGDA